MGLVAFELERQLVAARRNVEALEQAVEVVRGAGVGAVHEDASLVGIHENAHGAVAAIVVAIVSAIGTAVVGPAVSVPEGKPEVRVSVPVTVVGVPVVGIVRIVAVAVSIAVAIAGAGLRMPALGATRGRRPGPTGNGVRRRGVAWARRVVSGADAVAPRRAATRLRRLGRRG